MKIESQILHISHSIKAPAVWEQFVSFIPVGSLLVHFVFVVNLTSDCAAFADHYGSLYLTLMHLGTLFGYAVYHVPHDGLYSVDRTGVVLIALKSFGMMWSFNAWTVVRAKPYKCLFNEYSSAGASVYFILVHLILGVASWFIARQARQTDEVKKLMTEVEA